MTAPLEDGFQGATMDKGQADGSGFDANKFFGGDSFFGDLGSGDGGLLEGALEEGLEAPPEEELALDPDLQLDDDEDLSYASMFALGLGDGGHAGDHSLERARRDPEGALTNGGHFEQAGLPLTTPPAKAKPGSIALGGLLTGTPSSGLPAPSPLGQGTPFGSLPAGSSTGFLAGAGFGGAISQPLQDPAIAHIGPPPMALQHQQQPLLSSLPGMPGPARPLSAQDLEAQLLGGGGLPPPLPHFAPMQPPHMMGPPGGAPFPPLPPHMQPPMHGGLPPPPSHHLQQPQLPYDANGHFHRPPLPAVHAGAQLGPPRPMGAGSGFGPAGMMPHPHPHHPRPYPPLPPHMQHMAGQPMAGPPPPHVHAPPPPPLGGGMPRGPMPMRPAQGLRPGPPGPFRPQVPGGMPLGPPMHPGPWGRPPGFPPGFQPQQQQPPTLAQRLRALNLADRHEADRYPVLRRRYYSKYMDHEDIESILHMQWRPLHMGSPYVEDYYYQAFVYKHYNKRNRRTFAPESVRELAPTERLAADQVAFVKLEGLGKVPFSNIRRPRPLMDLTPHQEAKENEGPAGGADAAAAPSKPLEQEPLLAARIMIEDCMALLLDVEDIDRIFVAAGGAPLENEGALRTRRVLLMEGFAVSLRLPESPLPSTAAAGQQQDAGGEGSSRPEMSDGVFVRLMSLAKGKTLTARALRLVYPPAETPRPGSSQSLMEAGLSAEQQAQQQEPAAQQAPNLRVLWAVMRNLRGLFSGKPSAGRGGKDASAVAKDDLAASAKLAASAADLVKQLPQGQALCDCLDAILAGDLDGADLGGAEALLLPLFAPGHKASDTQVPWLCNVLEALLQRAAELDLAPAHATSAAAPLEPAAKLAPRWQQQFGHLYELVHRHTSALHEAFRAGREMGDTEGCAEVRGLVPIALIRTMLPHCTKLQQDEMRGMLVDFGA